MFQSLLWIKPRQSSGSNEDNYNPIVGEFGNLIEKLLNESQKLNTHSKRSQQTQDGVVKMLKDIKARIKLERLRSERDGKRLIFEHCIKENIFQMLSSIAMKPAPNVTRELFKFMTDLISYEKSEILMQPQILAAIETLLYSIKDYRALHELRPLAVSLLGILTERISRKVTLLRFWMISSDSQLHPDVNKNPRREMYFIYHLLQDSLYYDSDLRVKTKQSLLRVIRASERFGILDSIITESQLPYIMAAKLVAMYSLLSRTFDPKDDDYQQNAMVFLDRSGRDESTTLSPSKAKAIETAEYEKNLDAFLFFLDTWQTIICNISAENLRSIFLEAYKNQFVLKVLVPLMEGLSIHQEKDNVLRDLVYLEEFLLRLQHSKVIESTYDLFSRRNDGKSVMTQLEACLYSSHDSIKAISFRILSYMLKVYPPIVRIFMSQDQQCVTNTDEVQCFWLLSEINVINTVSSLQQQKELDVYIKSVRLNQIEMIEAMKYKDWEPKVELQHAFWTLIDMTFSDFITNSLSLNLSITSLITNLLLNPIISLTSWSPNVYIKPLSISEVKDLHNFNSKIPTIPTILSDNTSECPFLRLILQVHNQVQTLYEKDPSLDSLVKERTDILKLATPPNTTTIKPSHLESELPTTPKKKSLYQIPFDSPDSPVRKHLESTIESLDNTRSYDLTNIVSEPSTPTSRSKQRRLENKKTHIVNNIILFQQWLLEVTAALEARYVLNKTIDLSQKSNEFVYKI